MPASDATPEERAKQLDSLFRGMTFSEGDVGDDGRCQKAVNIYAAAFRAAEAPLRERIAELEQECADSAAAMETVNKEGLKLDAQRAELEARLVEAERMLREAVENYPDFAWRDRAVAFIDQREANQRDTSRRDTSRCPNCGAEHVKPCGGRGEG